MTTQARPDYNTDMTDDICPCCKAKQRAELVAREWERQSRQWEGAAKVLRKKLDEANAIAVVLSTELAALEHRLGEAHQTLTVAEQQGT